MEICLKYENTTLTDNELHSLLNNIQAEIVVVTFINSSYMPIFSIFMQHFPVDCKSQIVVVAIDEKSYLHIRKTYPDVIVLLAPYTITKKAIFWKFRYQVFAKLHTISRKHIIHTDSDCIWLRNILEIPLLQNHEYDIVGSIAYGMPMPIVKKMGFVLCCGFFKICYNERTRSLLEYIDTRPYNKHINDDQVKFNRYLCFEHQSKEKTDVGFVLTMKNSGVRIIILADKYISRSVERDLYCFHPYLGNPHIQGKKAALMSLLQKIDNFR